ncbi:putative NBD/HSP70 family sugar kinase [Actinoplanes lutulentus]|uniref:Putative NBD/HSP70 family sugar kinase n=1 Tax=Actinoplanes lutulentus TaxID=1287878 RepID=A0A327ZKC3_9ACTN|nr:ROK family protein [Actinoplanes lutulentus]MBB2945748.1 putative NBD/HSP70 family sugar kinase [Actinoplanes lutulentus]RAK37797.1 putative NBD/HSP70 family sugar kinase [Actinoplanes lutulentus]
MTTRSTELLRVVHHTPGVTRADAARLLGVGTGAATELVTKLSRASLLVQAPAAPSGSRGRPTTVLLPHPEGPVVLAVAITHEAWRVDVVELGGATAASRSGRHASTGWDEVRATVTAAIAEVISGFGDRPRAVGVSVPGTVSRSLRLDASTAGWHDVDLTALWPAADVFVAGNDATLAATAESRRGAAVGAAVALHLRIEAGLGGAVVEGGRPTIGALGAAGEFGHMPFGDPSVRCPCGAPGCWGTAVDGTALARLLSEPPPRDPVTYARRVIATARAEPQSAELTAVQEVGAALGRGMAGLVNGLDVDLVTLGGLGVDLLAAVPDAINTAYRDGLMLIHRASPPPVLPATLGDDEGPIAGAAEEAWAALLPQLT